jgi:cysteine desulfurase
MDIYLDNAATTAVMSSAAEKALEMMTGCYGNPSSTHKPGRDAKRELELSRATIAKALGAADSEIYFTSGGTESDNWALLAAAEYNARAGRHIISSAAEHDAVLKCLEHLEQKGFEVTLLPPGRDGSVSVRSVEDALRPDTCLVSLMYVNNETGAVTDIPAVSSILRQASPKAIFHTDAVQAFLKIPLDVKRAGIDMLTVSGHKVHAPKGVGALFVRNGFNLPSLLRGGGQERGKRAGTEALPLIAAFSAAVCAGVRTMDEDTGRMNALRGDAARRLSSENPGLVLIGGGAPHILSFSLPGYKSEVLMNYLEGRGIYVSKSSACKRGGRSHVLSAMRFPAEVIDGAIRVSLSRFTTAAEIDVLCAAVLSARSELLPVRRPR